MVVPLQTGQPAFKVPVPGYVLSQVPCLLLPAPPASHPWVKSENKQLLPSGMGQPLRTVLPKAGGASASINPQAALWAIGPLRGKGSC